MKNLGGRPKGKRLNRKTLIRKVASDTGHYPLVVHWILNMFLDRTQPRWAVISAGRNNPFGHPSKETLARLRSHSVWPLLTTEEGAITMETDGERYWLWSHVCGTLESGPLPPR